MRKKLVVAHFALMLMLFGSDLHGQESFEKVRKRANPFEPIILAAASKYNVDPHLLWTIAYLESRFNPQAISYKDGRPCAFGLMQFVASTAQQYGLKDPHNSRLAIDAAARYVRDLLKRFSGHGGLVLAAYNAGEGAVEAYRDGKRLVLENGRVINPIAIRTGGIPPYAETQAYVARGAVIYQNITRQQIFTAPLKSSGLPPLSATGIDSKKRQVEVSIYVLISGSSSRSLAAQTKRSEGREDARTRSLYAN